MHFCWRRGPRGPGYDWYRKCISGSHLGCDGCPQSWTVRDEAETAAKSATSNFPFSNLPQIPTVFVFAMVSTVSTHLSLPGLNACHRLGPLYFDASTLGIMLILRPRRCPQ